MVTSPILSNFQPCRRPLWTRICTTADRRSCRNCREERSEESEEDHCYAHRVRVTTKLMRIKYRYGYLPFLG